MHLLIRSKQIAARGSRWVALAVLLAATLAWCGVATGADYSPYQSTADPLGLDLEDDVRVAGSDKNSGKFQSDILPELQLYLNGDLTRSLNVDSNWTVQLDPTQLTLPQAKKKMSAYFVGENSTAHHSLGYNTSGMGVGSGDPKLLFPDLSSADAGPQSNAEPLLSGDFVKTATLDKNNPLDFFLIADGANGGTTVFSLDASVNPDGLQHAVVHALPDSPYLFLGFDATLGGSGQYNDVLLAFDIGKQNVTTLIATIGTPEPGTPLLLGSLLMVMLLRRRRRR